MPSGYPEFVLVVTLVVGIPLAVMRPYFAFCVAFLLLITADFPTYAYTRFPELGRYFNLMDALLVVCATGAFFSRRPGGPIIQPRIAYVLVAIISFGMLVSWRHVGYTEQGGRLAKYLLHFPVLVVSGAWAVRNERRIYHLLMLMLVGGLVQSLRQCLFFTSALEEISMVTDTDILQARSIVLLGAGNILLPFGCLLEARREKPVKWLSAAALGVGVVALILRQTKSQWLPQAFALSMVMVMLLRKPAAKVTSRRLIVAALVAILAGVLFEATMGGRVHLVDIFFKGRMTQFDMPDAPQSSTLSRWNAIKVELRAWYEGNWIWGNGLGYYGPVRTQYDHTAWGHVGYVAYLANLGLIGFFVYGLYVPIQLFLKGKTLWFGPGPDVHRCIGIYAVACAAMLLIATAVGPGLSSGRLYGLGATLGVVWTLTSRSRKRVPYRLNVPS